MPAARRADVSRAALQPADQREALHLASASPAPHPGPPPSATNTCPLPQKVKEGLEAGGATADLYQVRLLRGSTSPPPAALRRLPAIHRALTQLDSAGASFLPHTGARDPARRGAGEDARAPQG